MNCVKLTEEKLDVKEIISSVSSPACGSTSVFIGTTRDTFEGKKVLKLSYEAHSTMAKKSLEKLCEEVRQRWKVHGIAIFHRLGEVPVKEESVIIAISSEHRRESIESVQFCIDTLKAQIPIWKKEIYADGASEWKENKECSWNTEK